MTVYETQECNIPQKNGGFIMDDYNTSSSPAHNAQDPINPATATILPASATTLEPKQNLQPWERLRRLFTCNPFYLLSAALLLYSFYLVSADRSFLPGEIGQLSFNLSSLQLYQILLVVTAIFLARRAVWYDSTLLVGLENLLLLVPFILISQAALIDLRLVWILSGAAGLIAGGRLSLLRRFISRLNFPSRVAWIGILVLGVNAVLPAVYRVLHESKFGTMPDWGAAYETNQYLWWFLVPILCGLIAAVPWSRTTADELWPQRCWLPLGLFCLWLTGTGVHLYCLGYVYDFALRPELLAPSLWTLSWVLYLRVDHLLPGLKESWKNSLWALPLAGTLLATPQPEKAVFLALTVVNVSLFGWIYLRRRIPLALHFALISLVALVGGLPEEWARHLATQFNRETFIAAAAVIYLLICIALTHDSKLGVLGGLAAAISVSFCAPGPDSIHWAVQAGLVFLLLHSLRWIDSEQPGASLLRWLTVVAWIAHSLAWTHLYGAGWRVCTIAVPVLAVWFMFRWLRGKWGHIAIPLGSLLVLLSAPGHVAAVQLQSAPADLLAVIGSFILFGLGTLGAITKRRWASQ
jgi:hypothetical protein